MKIRKGFVSNSSSSSYIIAYKVDTNKCEHCGRSDPNITAMFELDSSYQEEYSSIYASGKDEVIEELKDMYGINSDYGDDTQTARFIKESKKVVDKLEEGYEVACIRVPYRDETTLDVLQNSPNVEFLANWG